MLHARMKILASALVLVACTPKDRPPEAPVAAPVNVVNIVARDFSFAAPDTIPSGLTTIRLVTEGTNIHHAQLIRLTDGKTVADVEAALKAGGPFPAWAREAGGPNPPAPGDTSITTLNIEPGNYALLCFVDTPDKVPHVAKGMIQPLTVVPASGPPAPAPEAHVTMTLTDYAFSFSAPLTAGKHVVRIDNAASQPHEVVIVRFPPDKSMEDLMQWAQTYQGPPPAHLLGGTAGLASGMSTWATLDLVPGNYGLLCFVPDAKDGKPHIVHGMVSTFTIS